MQYVKDKQMKAAGTEAFDSGLLISEQIDECREVDILRKGLDSGSYLTGHGLLKTIFE